MNCPLNVLYLYNIFVIFFQFSCFAHQSSHKKIAKICLVIFKEKVNLVPLVGLCSISFYCIWFINRSNIINTIIANSKPRDSFLEVLLNINYHKISSAFPENVKL